MQVAGTGWDDLKRVAGLLLNELPAIEDVSLFTSWTYSTCRFWWSDFLQVYKLLLMVPEMVRSFPLVILKVNFNPLLRDRAK